MLQKPEISTGLMGQFTRTQTLPLPFTFQKAGEKTGGFCGMMGVSTPPPPPKKKTQKNPKINFF